MAIGSKAEHYFKQELRKENVFPLVVLWEKAILKLVQ